MRGIGVKRPMLGIGDRRIGDQRAERGIGLLRFGRGMRTGLSQGRGLGRGLGPRKGRIQQCGNQRGKDRTATRKTVRRVGKP